MQFFKVLISTCLLLVSGFSLAKNSEQDMSQVKEIYLAGGCFWGVEEYFSRIKGVIDVSSGYANGHTQNPTYQQVITQTTGYAETVKITYDSSIVPLATLIDQYFKIIDPTSFNKQGNDRGDQYRTGIYYTDSADLNVIEPIFQKIKEKYAPKTIYTQLEPLTNFYLAEDYHQDYLKKNPYGYCHISFDSLNELKNLNLLVEE